MHRRNYHLRLFHSDNNKRSPSTIANNKERNPLYKNFARNYPAIFIFHYKLRRGGPFSWSVANKPANPFQHLGLFPEATRRNSLCRVEGTLEESAVHYANRVCHTTRHNVTFAPSELERHQYNAGGFVLKFCMMICMNQSSATCFAAGGKELGMRAKKVRTRKALNQILIES